MDYKDFVEQVKEQIRDYLPEKFRNAEISVLRLSRIMIAGWTDSASGQKNRMFHPPYI